MTREAGAPNPGLGGPALAQPSERSPPYQPSPDSRSSHAALPVAPGPPLADGPGMAGRAPGRNATGAASASAQVGDLAAATLLAFVGAAAVAIAPPGSPARVALTAPTLLVVPGYLLLQALLVPVRPWPRRGLHAVVALGLSPAIVGLLALATALAPGGFKPMPLVAAVTFGCVAMAALAAVRRMMWARARAAPRPTSAPA